jgi:hypothetical protein
MRPLDFLKPSARILLSIPIVLSVGGCWNQAPTNSNQKEPLVVRARETAPSPKPLPPIEGQIVELPGEEDACIARYRSKTDALIESQAYEQLEKMANSLRGSKVQLARGVWDLGCFYVALSPADDANDAAWGKRKEQLQKWCMEKPLSVAATISFAQFWVDYAWKARGKGWARDVSDSQWQLFHDRLQKSADQLRLAKDLTPRCPGYYNISLKVALGMSLDRENYDKLFQEAIAFEPQFMGYYFHKANYLQPRWHGRSQSEWLEFITAESDKKQGEDSDIFYARTALCGFGYYPAFLQESAVDWARLRRGLELLVERYPDSLWAKSQLCYFCGQKGERGRAKELFEEIGPNVYTPVWDKARFFEDRAWAFKK